MTNKSNLVIIALILSFLWSCSESTAPEEDIDYSKITEISYSKHVQPILNEYAEILIAEDIYPPELDMDSWDNLIKGWERGEVIIPFTAQNSLLIKLTTALDYNDKLRDDKLDLLERWIDLGAMNDEGDIPYQDASDLIYLCNQGEGTISIIDAQNHLVIRTVILSEYGYSSGSKPHHIVVEPDGSHWYVSLIADGKVLKFNNNNKIIGTADTPTPGLLAHHPTENKLYAGRSMTAPTPPSSIISIDKTTMEISEIPLAFARPHALLVQSTGEYVYAASLVENKIAVINAGNDEVEEYYTLEGDNNVFVQFAESADNSTLYATGQVTNQLLIFDVNSTGSLEYKQSASSGAEPWHPVLGKNGNRLYFGNKGSNSIYGISTLNNQLDIEITGPGIASPHGSSLSDDGKYLFISNQNLASDYTPYYPFADDSETGTVTVIDTEKLMIIKTIEVGKTPSGMGS
jgi:DNA-binding beta-propeller fold protein YncE